MLGGLIALNFPHGRWLLLSALALSPGLLYKLEFQDRLHVVPVSREHKLYFLLFSLDNEILVLTPVDD